MEGPSKIGADNGFFPFSSIRMAPQDITYAGEPTKLENRDHNKIREFVTINRGTVKGGGVTRGQLQPDYGVHPTLPTTVSLAIA